MQVNDKQDEYKSPGVIASKKQNFSKTGTRLFSWWRTGAFLTILYEVELKSFWL